MLTPLGSDSARKALLDIATSFHRDNTPKIIPTLNIRDNDSLVTSEGESNKEHDLSKDHEEILSTEGSHVK